MQLAAALHELESCNQAIERYGLCLSAHDARALVAGRFEALETCERVEFGAGIARELVLAFCSSPYVSQDTFIQTVLELQDLFYHFKGEALEQIPDDELIETMRSLYDDVAHGDLEFLSETLLDGLCRDARMEALERSAVGLAATRSDEADWIDQVHAPGWDGERWSDE